MCLPNDIQSPQFHSFLYMTNSSKETEDAFEALSEGNNPMVGKITAWCVVNKQILNFRTAISADFSAARRGLNLIEKIV